MRGANGHRQRRQQFVPVSGIRLLHGDHVVHVEDRGYIAYLEERPGQVIGLRLVARSELSRDSAGHRLTQDKLHRVWVWGFLNIANLWHCNLLDGFSASMSLSPSRLARL